MSERHEVEEARVVLAIETSQRRGSVAVRDRAGQVHRASLGADLRHDDSLLPEIDRLYGTARLEPADTGLVCVSAGPGGFTGLRIGVATAKLLAEVVGCDLVAVPSALAVAGSFDGPGPVIVALAAKGDSAWVTRLSRAAGRSNGESWSLGDDGKLADHLELEGISTVLADEHLPRGMRACCENARIAIVEPVFEALACMNAGLRLAAAGRTVSPATLVPVYSRPPAVTLRGQ